MEAVDDAYFLRSREKDITLQGLDAGAVELDAATWSYLW